MRLHRFVIAAMSVLGAGCEQRPAFEQGAFELTAATHAPNEAMPTQKLDTEEASEIVEKLLIPNAEQAHSMGKAAKTSSAGVIGGRLSGVGGLGLPAAALRGADMRVFKSSRAGVPQRRMAPWSRSGSVNPQANFDPEGGESYGEPTVNAFILTEKDHLSTFAADVDTASYTLARAKLVNGVLPPAESVRVEEWVNYFTYRYPQPEGSEALGVTMNAAPSPFDSKRTLLQIGIQGRSPQLRERKPAHLTFLVDVSGSMQSPERLPLAKQSLRMLVDQLRDGDTVALVTYAGHERLVLPHTSMVHKAQIHEAIENLSSGGGTSMGSGIELAYGQALKVLDSKSTSRVIILSDGDANIGPNTHEDLLKIIAGHVKEGVTVTTVGFGMGNYKAELMEQFADKGNGNHFYVDTLMAARRIFVEQLGSTLDIIAQDVKLQVDFDPKQVSAYRLVGYENRDIADRDFRNDRVDAGEIGAGHRVTALYELELKQGAGEGLARVRIRAKAPRGTTANERAFVFSAANLSPQFDGAPADFRFATAVMGAAEIFRRSPSAAEWSYDVVRAIAAAATPDGNAERIEFLSMLEKAKSVGNRVASR